MQGNYQVTVARTRFISFILFTLHPACLPPLFILSAAVLTCSFILHARNHSSRLDHDQQKCLSLNPPFPFFFLLLTFHLPRLLLQVKNIIKINKSLLATFVYHLERSRNGHHPLARSLNCEITLHLSLSRPGKHHAESPTQFHAELDREVGECCTVKKITCLAPRCS